MVAKKERIDLKKLFKEVGTKRKKTRLETLIAEGEFELKLLDAMDKKEKITVREKGKDVQREAKIVAQRDWFTENGDGTYNVKIGRANYALSGNTSHRMVVSDRAQLRAVIEQIIDDAKNDEEFKKFINNYVAPTPPESGTATPPDAQPEE